LKRVRDTYEKAIGDDVLVFLEHYLNLLGTRFMNDKTLDALCRQIYKNHRQALRVIWERVGSPDAASIVEVVHLLEEDARWEVLYRTSNYVDFMPKTWRDWLPRFTAEDYYPFCVHVRSKETDIGYTVFVGPMKNAAKRGEIVTKLRDASPGFGFKRSKGSQIEGKWNRIWAVETFLDWGEEDELPEQAVIREKGKKMLDELYHKLEKLASVFKPLCGSPA
jgi:hypothetical protein